MQGAPAVRTGTTTTLGDDRGADPTAAPNRFLMCRNVVARARDFGCRQPLLSTLCPLKPLKPLVTLSVAFLMVFSTFLPT